MENTNDKFKQLAQSYIKNLPNRILEVENAFNKLNAEWNSENFTNFYYLIHKLHGSAGIYGFFEISRLFGKIENIISRYDHDIPAANPDKEQIQLSITEAHKLIQTISPEPCAIEVKKIDTTTICLLNSENDYYFGKEWTNKLTKELMSFGYTLLTFNNISDFISELKNKNPLAIIVNYDFIFNPFDVNIADDQTKEVLKLYFKSHYTIFVSKSGEFDKRLSALRMNGKSYLLLPFTTAELASELDNLKYIWEDKFKAIVIDDDKDVLKYTCDLLTKGNIENLGSSSYQDIEKLLHEFHPDVLIFDLNMEGCNGMELAAIIRQKKIYEFIPIIYLSTEENKIKQLQAMNVGAEDFLTKATDPNIIIQTIRMRASRYKKIQSSMSKDNLTGAFNIDYILKEMEKYIRIYQNTDKKLTIAILEIDNLKSIKNSYGYQASDQVLINLYVLLYNKLDISRIIGRYGADQFIILFPNTTSQEVENELKIIQDKFRSTLQYANGKAYGSAFKIAVATYEKDVSIKKFIKSMIQKMHEPITTT